MSYTEVGRPSLPIAAVMRIIQLSVAIGHIAAQLALIEGLN